MSHLLIPQEFDAHINSLLNASWLVLGFEDRDGLRQAQTHTVVLIFIKIEVNGVYACRGRYTSS